MGTRKHRQRQKELSITHPDLTTAPGHAFYDRVNELLDTERFGEFAEKECADDHALRDYEEDRERDDRPFGQFTHGAVTDPLPRGPRVRVLDASSPARPNARVQILATGLGRVTPDWPAGVAAPLSSPPRVNASVHVWLDRAPVDVTEAVLAAGYAGMYVVEMRLPSIVNAGPAELYIDADGHGSNRVRIWVEP